ncbi:hypothetical protein B0H13DRAFT_1920398 [Mycena leptocephala]|nr:hypothetical protein B0H13DRAFT_1920398 [Mycena leptocephala]
MPMDRASTLWGMEAVRVRVRDGPRGRTTVREERGGRKQVSWLGFHPMSQHTLFEAASGLDLGYEYRREDAFANHLPSYSQLTEFATVRARRIHRQFTYASHRLPLYCDPSTEEGGDDKGRAGALIMNGDMIQARFLMDGSGWVFM